MDPLNHDPKVRQVHHDLVSIRVASVERRYVIKVRQNPVEPRLHKQIGQERNQVVRCHLCGVTQVKRVLNDLNRFPDL